MESRNLDSRKNTADNQGSRNEVLGDISIEIGGRRNYYRRGYDTGQHGKSVLKSKEESENYRHAILEAEKGSTTLRLLHERQVGLEEEGYACQPQFNCLSIYSHECFTHHSHRYRLDPGGW